MKTHVVIALLLCSFFATHVVAQRPAPADRKFTSTAVEDLITEVSSKMRDKDLARVFSNAFPNTLDTTVFHEPEGETGKPDTFIITGDIPSMWLRDSTNQVWPYLPLMRRDPKLAKMVHGLLERQKSQILKDPYANAFNINPYHQISGHTDDRSYRLGFLKTRYNAMNDPWLWERKYELDSLCAFLRLSVGYYENNAEDVAPFDSKWIDTVKLILKTIVEQQKSTAEDHTPEYTFSRTTDQNTETLHQGRHCSPAKRTGMSKSPFRPSDDSCKLPFLVPANAMAVVSLKNVAMILTKIGQEALATQSINLANQIDTGIKTHALRGNVFAYEVDGFGSQMFMDDANVPSLLSLPYLGYIDKKHINYVETRKYVLSNANPWYFSGSAGRGIGGPHNGLNMIWPMSIIMQVMTSDDENEIKTCLETLKKSSAFSGFIHESFHRDNVYQYTRSWFAWANTLFGEMILLIAKERPHLLY
jgi:meiotically up-regulated gene 157 (Mug157) protein